ncbi:MAG: hypothetical protein FK734_13800 [Asgard group archaeon]|nr:hypothetical protein [Asgard group archaeon]
MNQKKDLSINLKEKKMRETYQAWFIISDILGIFFIIWGAITENHPLIPGDVWLVLPGIILFIVGTYGIIEGFLISKRLLFVVKKHLNDDLTLESLANYLNMTVESTRELLMIQRSRGKLPYTFDPESGILIQSSEIGICEQCANSNVTTLYCPVCGTIQKKDVNMEK